MWDRLEPVGAFVACITLVIANLAEKRREQGQPYAQVALVSYLILIAFYLLEIVSGARLLIFGLDSAVSAGAPVANGDQIPTQIDSLSLIGWGLVLPAVAGMALLLPVVRRGFARFIPIDPDSPVHAQALSLTSLVVTYMLVTLGVGLGNLAVSLEQGRASEYESLLLIFLWGQQLLTALFAMIGVGWLTRRTWGETLKRLGLVAPSWRQVAAGIGLALLLIPLVIAIENLSALLNLGENSDVEKLSEQLLGPLFRSPIGIFTVGAAAAIGEETLLRGALLPRFGLLFTSLIFALLHSNYGLSISTIVVFLLGLILGVVRIRANTTSSMIVHAVYNSTLGLLVYLGM